MIEDKIALALKDIAKIKQELKEIKKDMKDEEKLDTEEYLQLKSSFRDLKTQVKDLEDGWKQELAKDNGYNQLRELRLKKEEELARANELLFGHIAELPPKAAMWNVELDEGPIRVNVQPEMRLYLNGKEEKKRA